MFQQVLCVPLQYLLKNKFRRQTCMSSSLIVPGDTVYDYGITYRGKCIILFRTVQYNIQVLKFF